MPPKWKKNKIKQNKLKCNKEKTGKYDNRVKLIAKDWKHVT